MLCVWMLCVNALCECFVQMLVYMDTVRGGRVNECWVRGRYV